MAIAKVIELTASSPDGFDQAIRDGLDKAAATIHGIKGAWVDGMKVTVEDGRISEYRVDLKISFVLD